MRPILAGSGEPSAEGPGAPGTLARTMRNAPEPGGERQRAARALQALHGERTVRGTLAREGTTMAGTIDSAIERKRDKDPAHVAEKQQKLESDDDRQAAERKRAHESPRETPKTD